MLRNSVSLLFLMPLSMISAGFWLNINNNTDTLIRVNLNGSSESMQVSKSSPTGTMWITGASLVNPLKVVDLNNKYKTCEVYLAPRNDAHSMTISVSTLGNNFQVMSIMSY
jgi:hypothetical protein